MKRDYSLDFEYCVRQFLGDKAYHIADSFRDPTRVRFWLRKCVSVMRKRVEKLDTTVRHKEMLLREVERLDESLRAKGNREDTILASFWLISRLLGFDGVSGKVYNEPFYFQNYSQYLREKSSWGVIDKSLWDIEMEERRNTISLRKKVYKYLKESGLSDNKIAQVMNISEYELKKLKHDI